MKTDFGKVIDSFSRLKVMIIGDVMIDAYLWGKVERISPEAPVPVVTRTSEENRLGGAANVALNIQSLGATPILCSVIGSDMRSLTFYELLKKQEISAEGILEDDTRMTTVKTRIISNHQHLLRVDREIDTPLSPDTEKLFLKRIFKVMSENSIDSIIFQDYDKGCITPEIIRQVVAEAQKHGIPTLVDPKKRNFAEYHHTTLFKPNFKELTEGLKVDASKKKPETLLAAAQMLHTQKDISLVMITLSEAGVFISTGRDHKIIPAHIRDIADVSGAGDTVISVASLGLAAGLSPYETAALANMAGGLVCEKIGVVPIDKDQLKAEAAALKI